MNKEELEKIIDLLDEWVKEYFEHFAAPNYFADLVNKRVKLIEEIKSKHGEELSTIINPNLDCVYKLFKYTYSRYVQGVKQEDEEYALLYVPKVNTFDDNKADLFRKRNKRYHHEVDMESIEDLTINHGI